MTAASAVPLLATIPSPDRGVWHLGPVPIRAYALCIIVGIVVCVWWSERRFVARGGKPGTVMDIAVYAVPFGLLGGRIYHLLTDWSTYFGPGGHPAGALKIWEGGLGIWGAISLGALGAWIGARRKGVPLTAVADAAAPGIVVAQAIGRVGNWFNQELFGGPTSLPWGLEIYRRIDPVTGNTDNLGGIADGGPAIAVVHPTFLYELLWNLAVAALIVWADRRYRLGRGRVFALYVAGYTAGRFWIELMRTDTATMVFGVRINVITSVLVFLAAVTYLVLVRGPRETLAATEPAATEPAATEPAATEPAATEPAASEPAATEPAATEPAASEPAATEPAAQDDAGAGAQVGAEGGAEPAAGANGRADTAPATAGKDADRRSAERAEVPAGARGGAGEHAGDRAGDRAADVVTKADEARDGR